MSKLGFKIVAVVALSIALLVPLLLIRGLIQERTRYRQQASESIAESWTGAQTVVGPLLVVPLRPSPPQAADTSCPRDTNAVAQPEPLFLLPETLEIRAAVDTELRWRGLYAVPVYTTHLVLSGTFDLSAAAAERPLPWSDLELDRAVLSLALSDNRGIVERPQLEWDAEPREVSSGAVGPSSEGLQARVGPLDAARSVYPFHIELELRGMETLEFSPVGNDTRVTMEAAWPHPSFIGRFLPVAHEIGAERFSAEWRVSGLASGRPRAALGLSAGQLGNTFGVSLVNPVDIYQQALRSVKYGNLIVVLTFTTFFLVETVRRLMLHPMQYLLVGLALVMFFLLLVALSEHMPFGAAYLVSAGACVALVALYVAAALGRASGATVTGTLGGLYAMLYAILRSEDNALLMGSLLLFCALAAVMLVTRRFDWYRLGQQPSRETP